MASVKTVSKGIRLKAEVSEYFSGKPLNRYIESMYEHIQEGSIKEEEDGISVHTTDKGSTPAVPQNSEKGSTDSVHTEIDEATLADIEVMCMLSGTTIGEFMKKMCEAMNEGYVWYEGGRIMTKDIDGVDFGRFKEACRERNIEIGKMVEKCTQMVLRT